MTVMDMPLFVPQPKRLAFLRTLVFAGAALTGLGLFLAPSSTLAGMLLASCYGIGLALGALFLIALDYVTRAGWGVALRRVPEALATSLPLSAAALLLTLAVGLQRLYPWARPEVGHHAVDASLSLWRSPIFFFARAIVYVGLWLLFAWAIIQNSRRQDQNIAIERTCRNVRLSAVFLVVFALTLSLATFDWLMSLQAHWVSTIFAVYHFAGLFQAALAATAVLVIMLRRCGYFQQVLTSAHLHDLGKYIFAFTTFWGYIWFCQYMLIWYSNMPEETSYYAGRHVGLYGLVAIASVSLNWAIPFFALISARAKRRETLLLKVCAVILVGHWIDLFGIILPPVIASPDSSVLWSIAPTLALLPLLLMHYVLSLRKAPLVPLHDPMLIESLHHH